MHEREAHMNLIIVLQGPSSMNCRCDKLLN
jgi:hypothetical protein